MGPKLTALYQLQIQVKKQKNSSLMCQDHGLRTFNEGINQINLKIWADVADKICFGRT